MVPSIPTGRYTVTAEVAGFKTLALSNIELGVDQRARIDLKLEVGALTESVTIEAVSPLLQTSSSELGTTVKTEQLLAMPLNGRNFVRLTRSVPMLSSPNCSLCGTIERQVQLGVKVKF